MHKVNWKGLSLVVGSLILLVVVFSPSGVAENRPLVVTLDEPFEIDGEVYPPGKVTVKELRAYNPSSLLIEVRVGRKCLGVFQASHVTEDAGSSRSSLTFVRTAEGHLALVGFALGRHNTRETYRFHHQARAAVVETAKMTQ